jgi:hypothetical protein
MRTPLAALIIALLLTTTSSAQSWGLGIRLGDPSGLSVKKYGNGHAWEFSLGRTHLFSNNRYYNDRYYNWYNDQDFGYKEHELLNYRNSVPIGLQVHYLIHKPISNAEGLTWYYGVGGQLRTQRFEYDYRYKVENGPDWVVVNEERVTEVDLGVDGVLGLEYTFSDAPLAVFLDATLFMELFDDPFVFWPQLGLGIRYNF